MDTKVKKKPKYILNLEKANDDSNVYKQWRYKRIPQPKLRRTPPAEIDFELYVKENCHNKIKILNRETFHQIQRPLLIFFNHFREKCNYHTKWLDRMYELYLIYGENVEFIAADMSDMDLMFPGRNPLSFFSIFVRPEDVTPSVYAIDEKKRIHEFLDAYKEKETLKELCENLLKGQLFPSQKIPEYNESNLVKICVHENHEELVLKSSKNIFLIIELNKLEDKDVDYENVALNLKDHNLEVLYMEAEKNYIPFEYCAYTLPTLIFLPQNDKKNFVYYEDFLKEENIIEFLTNILENPKYLTDLQQKQHEKMSSKSIIVPNDFVIDFQQELPQFLQQHYGNSLKVLDRQVLEDTFQLIILIFMDFKGKCFKKHVNCFNKLYQVASSLYGFEFFIADFKEIDVINTKWISEDLVNKAQGKPLIYGVDRLKHTFDFGYFNSPTSLFYFADSLENGDFYYSQDYSRSIEKELVKDWSANYFNFFLKNLKKHIFITFYSGIKEDTTELLLLLEEIAVEVNGLDVEVVKFNIELNYVDLEYKNESYPVHYFIPKNNKKEHVLLDNNELSKDKMLDFIKNNVENNK